MDWFETLTGFREADYAETRAKLRVECNRLRSLVNNRSYGIGCLDVTSLADLRASDRPAGRLRVGIAMRDVRQMHRNPAYAGALFQVASQFNMLEMTSPDVTPEDGVARYAFDHTQGPACAIAAGAATIYRNYFALVNGQSGQTSGRQIDGLADIGADIAAALDLPVDALWTMKNGYALSDERRLQTTARYLMGLAPVAREALKARLRVGLHWDVEVTDAMQSVGPIVSQAFCSALPVAYCKAPRSAWAPLATLVLEAAYEATLWAAARNAARRKSKIVLLTSLGGGAFGNHEDWIDLAIRKALIAFADIDLDVQLVTYDDPPAWLRRIASDFAD